METLIWKERSIDVELEDLLEARLTGLARRRLILTSSERTWELEGPRTARLFVALQALGVPSSLDQPSNLMEDEAPLLTTASLVKGPLAHPGHLAIGIDALHFAPEGVLDGVIGVESIRLEINRIPELEVHQRRITFPQDSGTLAFSTRQASDVCSAILDIMALEPWELNEMEAAAVLTQGGWNLTENEELIVTGSGTLGDDEGRHVRSQLILTSRRLLLLSNGGSSLEIPRDLLQVIDTGGNDDDTDEIDTLCPPLALSDGTRVVVLGKGCSASLRAQVRTSLIEGGEAENVPVDLEHMRSIMGAVPFIRIVHDHHEIASFKPGFLMEQDDGVAVLLTGLVDPRCSPGHVVRMEIGRKSGVFAVRGRIVRLGPLPDPTSAPARSWAKRQPERPEFMAVIEPAEQIAFVHNRRDGFRISLNLLTRARRMEQVDGVQWEAVGETIPCELANLSNGGCALRLQIPLEPDDRVEIEIPIGEDTIPIQAEVVHLLSPVPEQLRAHGMRFVGLNAADHERVQQEVLRREAEILQEELLYEPALDDGRQSTEDQAPVEEPSDTSSPTGASESTSEE
jgi:hypothetical protein